MCSGKFANRFLAIFLVLVVSASALFAWPFFNSSDGSSQTNMKALEIPQTSEESLPPQSSTETTDVLKTASESLKVLETSSKSLNDEERKAVIDEVVSTIESVIENEKANIEDNNMIAEIVESYDGDVKKLERDINGPHFGIGISIGYNPLYTISPGIDTHIRVRNWIMSMSVSYDMDISSNTKFTIDPHNIEARIGIMYEF